jgi:hypothetical protein
MPTVFSFKECALHRQTLRDVTPSACPPILALHQAILFQLDESISDRTIR